MKECLKKKKKNVACLLFTERKQDGVAPKASVDLLHYNIDVLSVHDQEHDDHYSTDLDRQRNQYSQRERGAVSPERRS